MFYEGKKVLITGGTGFVGTNFVEELLKRGAKIRVPIHHQPLKIEDPKIEKVAANLENLDDCLKSCEGIDCVIHAAGSVGSAATIRNGKINPIAVNVILSLRILQAACETGVERVLLFSSSTGYPALSRPVSEDDMWTGDPHPTYFGYGWMRRYVELLGQYTMQQTSLKVAIVRPSAIYGAYDNFMAGYGHVIPALIQRAVERENPFVVWGTGDEVRDFLHVSDLVKGCLLMLEKKADGEPVNIGYGRETTMKETVSYILEAAGHTGAEIRYDSTKPQTIPYRAVDISKAEACLGFRPAVDLKSGIKNTVKWYEDNSNSYA